MAKIELERLISKRGLLSRKEAARAILEGKVKVNGQLCKIPLTYFDSRCKIEIAGAEVITQKFHYLILNKPRGLIVTRNDEKNRATVYECLEEWNGPLVQAVGRLDQASEGLLLFTNDHVWAEKLMNPKTHVKKIYHVQANPGPSEDMLEKLSSGIIIITGISGYNKENGPCFRALALHPSAWIYPISLNFNDASFAIGSLIFFPKIKQLG